MQCASVCIYIHCTDTRTGPNTSILSPKKIRKTTVPKGDVIACVFMKYGAGSHVYVL